MERKIKVLHIIDHPGIGGAQRVVADIIRHYPEAHLVALRFRDKSVRQIDVPRARYLITPVRSFPWFILKFTFLPFIIHRKQIEIIHCHLLWSWLAGLWISIFSPFQKNLRLVFHEHDSTHLEEWYYPWLLKAAQRAGKVIAVSTHIQQSMISFGASPEAVIILKNAVDPELFHLPNPQEATSLPAKYSLPCEKYYIGYASRLIAYKGWDYIIELAQELKDEKIHFLVAGDGPDRQQFEQLLQETSLEENIHLLGYVHQMDTFYHAIKALIVTTQKEAFGLVQIEAQACGVPVIAFDSAASQEVQGDHSILMVPFGNTAAMAENIRRILSDQRFAADIISRGLINAREYNLGAYIKRLDTIYQSL